MFGLEKSDYERAKNMAIYHVYATDKEMRDLGPGFAVFLIVIVIGLILLAKYL